MQHSINPDTTPPDSANLPQTPSLDYAMLIRQEYEEHARKEGDNNTLWQAGRSMFSALNMRFCLSQIPAYGAQAALPNHNTIHDLWFIYYHGSKNTSANSAAHSRLVFEVLRIQGQGDMSRRISASGGIETATTPDGTMWSDMPFFVSDMMNFWIKEFAGMSAAHRLNFSCFLAKLASVGLAKDKLCAIALILFRDTLETTRSLGDIDANSDEDFTRSMADLSISDLLLPLGSWIGEMGSRIAQLSDESWHDCSDEAGAIGPMYRDDASTSKKVGRFGTERWIFWLRRLEQIDQEADGAGNKELAKGATDIMDTMLLEIRLNHSAVREDFEASPAVVKYRNLETEEFMSGL